MADFFNGSYCGQPPAPAELWSRWVFDPLLLSALTLIGVAYMIAARREPLSAARQWCFGAGFAVAALALISPLCALSVALFSARVAQHMILTLIAAPLLVLGGIEAIAPRFLRAHLAWVFRPMTASLLFAVSIWFWHTPAPYAATFENTAVYWLMHLSMFASALAVWSGLLRGARCDAPWAVVAGLFSTVQMSLLGALLTLATAPLFSPHRLTAALWGFDPLADQQLGGVFMWAPGCMAFVVGIIAPALSLVRDEPAPVAVR